MRVVVIGGGPAGIMATISAINNGNSVVLIEKNEKIGRKLYISGKGRCNVSNASEAQEFLSNVVSNPKFLSSAIRAFSPNNVMEFFESRGVKLKVERGNRIFPVSDKSSDIIDALYKELHNVGADLRLQERVVNISKKNDIFYVKTSQNTYECDAVIVATGGKSYPKTGSNGEGYEFAKELGHSIVEIKPALAPILLKSKVELPQGLSLKNVTAKILDKTTNKTLAEDFGEMIFTDEGVSGPIVLSLSSRINRLDFNSITFAIDLKPALDHKQLDARILRDFQQVSNKQFKNSLDALLPKSMIPFIIELTGISPETTVNVINKEQRKKLVGLLKCLKFDVIGLAPLDEAIVTAGGVKVSEINPKTMESKLVKNLYFAGEIIDVDALTGGYNIQIALSTGYVAGRSIKEI